LFLLLLFSFFFFCQSLFQASPAPAFFKPSGLQWAAFPSCKTDSLKLLLLLLLPMKEVGQLGPA
jgi:hypothetical protein